MSAGDLLLPDQIFAGRYRVIRTLASGGMGMVFEAEHTGTEQRVALKLLLAHVVQIASARERFALEAKVAARIKSEHIVQVLDAGLDEATRSPYLVMELLDGETLAERVERRGPIDAAEMVTLLRQVASGLDAAHAVRDAAGRPAPIVHRDLKPENLVVTRRPDGSPSMKILDFGIAKILSESRNVSQEVRGTPLYMAFEQVATGPLSAQTDIWALGLIAYFVLTGRRYWKSADDPDAGIEAVFAEILSLPLLPASTRMREQGLSAQLPCEFDTWLSRCIDRVPARRFASATLAVDALERALGVHSAAQTVNDPDMYESVGRRPGVGELQTTQSSTAGSLPAIVGVALARARVYGAGRKRAGLALAVAVLVAAGAASFWQLRASEEPVAQKPAPLPESEIDVAPTPAPQTAASRVEAAPSGLAPHARAAAPGPPRVHVVTPSASAAPSASAPSVAPPGAAVPSIPVTARAAARAPKRPKTRPAAASSEFRGAPTPPS